MLPIYKRVTIISPGSHETEKCSMLHFKRCWIFRWSKPQESTLKRLTAAGKGSPQVVPPPWLALRCSGIDSTHLYSRRPTHRVNKSVRGSVPGHSIRASSTEKESVALGYQGLLARERLHSLERSFLHALFHAHRIVGRLRQHFLFGLKRIVFRLDQNLIDLASAT